MRVYNKKRMWRIELVEYLKSKEGIEYKQEGTIQRRRCIKRRSTPHFSRHLDSNLK
jgi:hypothetical protein